MAPHVQEFAIELVMATQPEQKEAHEMARKYVRYGSSPRGAQALVECGRVRALVGGRFHLSVEDILHVAPAVLRHRIILNFDAHADGQTPETILQAVYLLGQCKLDDNGKKWSQLIDTAAQDAARVNREIREILRSQS